MSTKEIPIVYLVEDRHTTVSPYGYGNTKLGKNIYTYSKLPGREFTCPGSTDSCEAYCYAKRLIQNNPIWSLLTENTKRGDKVPPIPSDAKIIRIHVSGDFDSEKYILSWVEIVKQNPKVIFYAYTRSWRCNELINSLNELRKQPNMFLWASIDAEMQELPSKEWRRAWLEGDDRLTKISKNRFKTFDDKQAVICLEENGLLPSCEACKYCWKDSNTDLVFLMH